VADGHPWSSYTAPTPVIWGRQDGIAPVAYAQELASRIPGARVEIIDRAGHLPQLEQMGAVLPLVTGLRTA